jgi:hypothetical protein
MESNVSKNSTLVEPYRLRLCLSCLSIQRLLQQQILNTLLLMQPQERWVPWDNSHRWRPETVPLYRLTYQTRIVYRCAVALRLANQPENSPQAIAQQLMMGLIAIPEDLEDCSLLDLEVRVNPAGTVDFYLSDRALALWLQALPGIRIEGREGRQGGEREERTSLSDRLFLIQYVHARCCSLLRLGHREGLIQLNDPDFGQPIWQWQDPQRIPWLHPDPEFGHFQLVHPAEQSLILQLCAVVDALASSAGRNWIKLATDLSEAMLNFNQCCRIWGEVKQETPTLAQARLGLIALTQRLLQGLLQEHIGAAAPIEL